MTPEELHSRILLHELRTILLDETREGDQLPEERKQILRDDPHNPSHYLILADWLEDQGSDLGELCRIQVELIGRLPGDWFSTKHDIRNNHHFWLDDLFIESAKKTAENATTRDMLTRRWEIVEPLYPPKECSLSHREMLNRRGGADWQNHVQEWIAARGIDLSKPYESREDVPNRRMVYTQSRRLGRTTRMLTDVLRYCCLNHGKHILVRLPEGEVEQSNLEFRFDRLCREVWGREPAWLETHTAHMPDCRIHFGDTETNRFIRTHRTSRTHVFHHSLVEDREVEPRLYARQRAIEAGFDPMLHFETEYSIEQMAWLSVQDFPPDITFTDHACQQPGEWSTTNRLNP